MKNKTFDTLRWIALPFWIIIGFILVTMTPPYIVRFLFYISWWVFMETWLYSGIEAMITWMLIAPLIAIIGEYIAPSHKGLTGRYSAIVISTIYILILLAWLLFMLYKWWDILAGLQETSKYPIFDWVASIGVIIIKIVAVIMGMVWVHNNTNTFE